MMFRRGFLSLLLLLHSICWAGLPDAKTKVFAGITPGVQMLKNGQETGSVMPVIKRLLKESGVQYEIRMSNWAQTHKQFAASNESMILGISRFSAREEMVQWIVPMAQLDLKLARSKYQPHINPTSFEDVKNYKLAVVRGATTEEQLKYLGFVEGEDYGAVATAEQLLKYMRSGFVEFVFYESTISPMMLELFKLPPDYLVPVEVVVPENDAIWLAASLDFPLKSVEKIRATHRRLLQEADYQSLLQAILPRSRKNPDFDYAGQSSG